MSVPVENVSLPSIVLSYAPVMLTVVLPIRVDGGARGAIGVIDLKLAAVPHEIIGIYEDVGVLREIEEGGPRPASLRLMRAGESFGATLVAAAEMAAGDVMAWVEAEEVGVVEMLPDLAETLRREHAAVVIAALPRDAQRYSTVARRDLWLAVLAGIPGWNPLSGRMIYSTGFVLTHRPSGQRETDVRLELLAAAQTSQTPIATFELPVMPHWPVGTDGPMHRGAWMELLLAPEIVWGLWLVMTVGALGSVFLHTHLLGRLANVAALAAGAFAFTLAVRRSRGRTRIADGFFALVLLNPLFYNEAAGPFDRTLLCAGLLALMAGAIVAMRRDALRRYVAVAVLALVLSAIALPFAMLLPALAMWLLIAGFNLARGADGGQRVRGFLVMAAGDAALMVFLMACIADTPTPSPTRATLFGSIVGFSEFPLLVIAIVVLALGWRPMPRRGRGGSGGKAVAFNAGARAGIPPHFAGMLALLVGLLTMLLNNFQAGALPPPGADQTALILCLLYTVFALHGPRRMQWLVPPLLLAAGASYLGARWLGCGGRGEGEFRERKAAASVKSLDSSGSTGMSHALFRTSRFLGMVLTLVGSVSSLYAADGASPKLDGVYGLRNARILRIQDTTFEIFIDSPTLGRKSVSGTYSNPDAPTLRYFNGSAEVETHVTAGVVEGHLWIGVMRAHGANRWYGTASNTDIFFTNGRFRRVMPEANFLWDMDKGTWTFEFKNAESPLAFDADHPVTFDGMKTVPAGTGNFSRDGKTFIAVMPNNGGPGRTKDIQEWRDLLEKRMPRLLHLPDNSWSEAPISGSEAKASLMRSFILLPEYWGLGSVTSKNERIIGPAELIHGSSYGRPDATYEQVGDVLLTPWSLDLGPIGLVPIKADNAQLMGEWIGPAGKHLTITQAAPADADPRDEFRFFPKFELVTASLPLTPDDSGVRTKNYILKDGVNRDPLTVYWFMTADKKLVRMCFPPFGDTDELNHPRDCVLDFLERKP